MADVYAVKKGGRVHIHGITRKGSVWMAEYTEPTVTMSLADDIAGELLATMRKAGLDVDERSS